MITVIAVTVTTKVKIRSKMQYAGI